MLLGHFQKCMYFKTDQDIIKKNCRCIIYIAHILYTHLSYSPVWLSEEVSVSLFETAQVQGVDCHMDASVTLW